MQIEFDGHPYLFVNPKFAGQYISPEQAAGKWINYGGDKLWLPEGNEDEHHWMVALDTLDDAPYAFKAISESEKCTVELDGPADDKTELQFSRQISISGKFPSNSLSRRHAKCNSSHLAGWAVQSVTQYNLANARGYPELIYLI